jgi:rubrerythrin
MKNKKIISLTLIFALAFTFVPMLGMSTFAQTDKNELQNPGTPMFTSDSLTRNNLYASVQGETNAAAAYRAFADKAEKEGYFAVANLFRATADAETKHADDEWAILQSMGETERPTAEKPTVGSTEQNLQTAFDGETYEYTVMYPGFLETAQKEKNTEAARIFRLAMKAEEVHANNYKDVLNKIQDTDYLNEKYGEVYRCVVCGEVVTELPSKCPICGALGDTFVTYTANEKNPLSNTSIAFIVTIAIIAVIAVIMVLIKKRNK